MRFADIMGRQSEQDPWDVSHLEDQVAGGSQHDRDYLFLEAVSLRRFTLSYSMTAKYPRFHSMENFVAVVRGRYGRRLGTGWNGGGSPWEDKHEVAKFMGEVVDDCKATRTWFHPGWLKVLYGLRDEIRGQGSSRGGDDGGN